MPGVSRCEGRPARCRHSGDFDVTEIKRSARQLAPRSHRPGLARGFTIEIENSILKIVLDGSSKGDFKLLSTVPGWQQLYAKTDFIDRDSSGPD
jgi:hypothetical protein